MDGIQGYEEAVRAEHEAIALFEDFVRDHAQQLKLVAGLGDGRCGWMHGVLVGELLGEEYFTAPRAKPKGHISAALRKQVMERDQYRCRHCASWVDLCLDHVVPEAKGGPTTADNLQVLCRPCNSIKGVS